MAIPGAIIFTAIGVTGQLFLNFLNGWRIRSILEQEELQKDKPQVLGPKETEIMDKNDEYERKFGLFSRLGTFKRSNADVRITSLKAEINKLDEKLKRVDDEIATLERARSEDVSPNGKQ